MQGMQGRLPNFFLAGVPKSGSTSLYRYLEQHPQIFMSPIKEPHFFADEVRIENFDGLYQSRAEPMVAVLREFLDGPMTSHCSAGPVSDWADYCKLFRHAADETAVGEASVCYLWSRTAARNIASRVPDARFLIVLRNPVERAFSQYVHMLSFAEEPVSFREHLDRSLRSTSRRFSEMYPFLEFGLYGEQLKRLFGVVPSDRVRIYFYEDYCRDPAAMLRDIFGFLGVDDAFAPEFRERHMVARVPRSYEARRWLKRSGAWRVARKLLPASLCDRLKEAGLRPRSEFVFDPADRAFVAEYYRRDLDKLAGLLGRDFGNWLSPTVSPSVADQAPIVL